MHPMRARHKKTPAGLTGVFTECLTVVRLVNYSHGCWTTVILSFPNISVVNPSLLELAQYSLQRKTGDERGAYVTPSERSRQDIQSDGAERLHTGYSTSANSGLLFLFSGGACCSLLPEPNRANTLKFNDYY